MNIMKYTDKQIQFIKKEATLSLIKEEISLLKLKLNLYLL